MSEKYTTLKSLSLDSDSRYPFSPDKIRILRRNEDGFTVLQIRLANNSDKVIVNAEIDIRCLPSGTVIKKVYSDFSAAKGEFFGTKVPVDAGKETVDSVEISVAEAVFEDGTVWTSEHFETEAETEESLSEKNVTENIVSVGVTDGAETYVGETAAVYEAETVPKAEPISVTSAAAEKIPLLKNIGKNKLIAGACGAAAVVAIIIAVAAFGGGDDSGEIVSETGAVTAETTTAAAVTEATTVQTTEAKIAEEKNYVIIKGRSFPISLTSLELSGDNLTDDDIKEIGKLVNLESLYLSNNQIGDISPLSRLTNLETLSLSNNQISDISSLSGLTNLKSLYLDNNQISNIEALSQLTNLEVLFLNNNQINDVSALEKLDIKNFDWRDNPGFTIEIPEKYTTDYKTFAFDGGYINYTEYSYYSSDGWEGKISFSADVNINDYPYAGTEISRAISSIISPPSAYELENSLSDPDSDALQMFHVDYERHQLTAVYAENDMLFITISNHWDNRGWNSPTEDYSYVFDIQTGNEIDVKNIFQDFESFKWDAVDLADKYIKENISYDVYSSEPYYDTILNSTWYNDHKWTYDGSTFTVQFGLLFTDYSYNTIYLRIPIAVEKGSENSQNLGYYEVYQYGYVNIDSDTLNVREEPSTGAKKIGSLADGAAVYIYSYIDGWYYIYYEDNELYGYVSSEFINLY